MAKHQLVGGKKTNTENITVIFQITIRLSYT